MPPRRRRHGLELGLILLLNELLQFGMKNIPPVTLTSILGQTLLYMGLINVPWDKEDVCLSGNGVLKNKDWKRLLLSALEHGDDMHLYYNMASFLIKGRSLEKRYGSKNFAFVLLFLTLVTSGMYLLLAVLMTEITENVAYMESCAIGFSGVIFALKVLTTHEEPNLTAMLVGIQIPGRYAAWIELILIHLLVPNSSFMGHLAGILAGVIYCNTIIGGILDEIITCLTGKPIIHQGGEMRIYAKSRDSDTTISSFQSYREQSQFFYI
ncbi:hypothetical protein RUM43_009225 [Polyplax serrata]|uniref:Peptidase S54 rhomboid domain-containing protein n=1 Tax=Polyplax serrata TaxID=468196 RepID=A0AAN8S1Z0_POLSC